MLAYLFFQRFRWVLDSGSDAAKLLLLCHDLTLSTFGAPLTALVGPTESIRAVSYTHLRAHETGRNLVCRLLLEKKNS